MQRGERPGSISISAVLNCADIFQIYPGVHLVWLSFIVEYRSLDAFANKFKRAGGLLVVDFFIGRLAAGGFYEFVENLFRLGKRLLSSSWSRIKRNAGKKESRRQMMAQVHEPSYFRV